MSKPKQVEGGQLERFKQAARELGCDESEEGFNAVLDKVLKAPQPSKKAAPKKSRAREQKR